jgi:hypothetical protein
MRLHDGGLEKFLTLGGCLVTGFAVLRTLDIVAAFPLYYKPLRRIPICGAKKFRRAVTSSGKVR